MIGAKYFQNRVSQDDYSIIEKYNQSTKQKKIIISLLLLACMLSGMVAISTGPVKMTFLQVGQAIIHKILPNIINSPGENLEMMVWTIRLPRFITALVIGFGLAIAGAVMQPVLRNSMASPFTLGISSGAGFGAAMVIVFGKGIVDGPYAVVANAFLFAFLTSSLVLVFSKRRGSSPSSMILAGIAFSFFFNALTALLKYFADPWALSEIVLWLMGTLSKGSWATLELITPVIFLCSVCLMSKSWELNVLGAGDDAAKSLGVNISRTRLVLLLFSSLLTATIVCFTGTIGFIGLVAPHIARIALGGDNRFVIPAAGVIGGLLLAISDIIAMNILSPIVLPIGIVTSLLGTPVFLHLIFNRQRGM